MKTALILETGEVPATIGIQELNPMLDLRDGAIHICQSNTPLGPSNAYRRASVNSFGYGGANAHAILDHTQSFLNDTLQAATLRASRLLTPGYVFIDASLQTSVKHYLLPFSAHNEMTLRHNINAIGASRSVSELPSLAFTLSNRRDLFRSRAFCITDEVDILSGLDFDLTQSATNQGRPPTIAFVFTGQGAQWAQMGLQLIDQFPTTRFTFTKLDQALAKTSSPPNWTILKILQEPGVSSRINDAEKSQTVCTAIQIALVDLLSTWRVEAVAVVGHSSGRSLTARSDSRILTGRRRDCCGICREKMLCRGCYSCRLPSRGRCIRRAASWCHDGRRYLNRRCQTICF
jgi:acyl transferase domain-containing protein